MFLPVLLSKSNFFTSVALVLFVLHWCHHRVVCVALVSHFCHTSTALVSLVSHSCRTGVASVALVLHSCRVITWLDIIQNRSHSKIRSFQIHSKIKHQASDYLETVVFRFKLSISKWSKKGNIISTKKYKKKFLLISLALFPIKWFRNTELFSSNKFKVYFLRRKLKVGFKAFNLVQDSTVLKATLKYCQH